MALKKTIGLDELHPLFLFFGLAFSLLILAIFYQWITQFYSWSWEEYIQIPSMTYRIICALCTAAIIELLHITGVFGVVKSLSENKKDYLGARDAIVFIISAAVMYWVAPAIIKVINFIMNAGYNTGLALILLIVTILAFLATMQLLRFTSKYKRRRGNKHRDNP